MDPPQPKLMTRKSLNVHFGKTPTTNPSPTPTPEVYRRLSKSPVPTPLTNLPPLSPQPRLRRGSELLAPGLKLKYDYFPDDSPIQGDPASFLADSSPLRKSKLNENRFFSPPPNLKLNAQLNNTSHLGSQRQEECDSKGGSFRRPTLVSKVASPKPFRKKFTLKTEVDEKSLDVEDFRKSLGLAPVPSSQTFLRDLRLNKYILEKNKARKSKFGDNRKIFRCASPIQSGSISIMLADPRQKRIDEEENMLENNKSLRSRMKMKWKTIQWLLENRKDAINLMSQNYHVLFAAARNKARGLQRKEFDTIMGSVGLGGDESLLQKLFEIFDGDHDGKIDLRDFILGLEVIKDNSFEDKMDVFFELADKDASGKISQEELYDILKRNYISVEEKARLKWQIKKLFKEGDFDGDGELNKLEMIGVVKRNTEFKNSLEETFKSFQNNEQMQIALERPFESLGFFNATTAAREGVFFPQVQAMIAGIRKFEELGSEARVKKLQIQELLKQYAIKEEDDADQKGEEQHFLSKMNTPGAA